MKLKQVAYGAATFIPGLTGLRLAGTGGTSSARYCYSVWLRHLAMANAHGLNSNPKLVAELGPGDSLGIGLAALISGCEKYYAFDVVRYASVANNLRVFDDLVELFRAKANIPGNDEFPNVKPYLDRYDFPTHLLTTTHLAHALDHDRLKRIKDAIAAANATDTFIEYRVPWFNPDVIEPRCVDMIFSQAVLEHVDDLANTYRAMRQWLKPGGFISHQIDFKSHDTARQWNGHWTYSDLMWKVIRGKRPYLLNREPYSTHLAYLNQEGFSVACDTRFTSESRLTRNDLAPRFASMPDDDLVTSGAFIQAVKR